MEIPSSPTKITSGPSTDRPTHNQDNTSPLSAEAGCVASIRSCFASSETNLWFPTIFNPSRTQNTLFYGSSNRTGLILVA
ncbi:MAG: hypothetical protein U0T36_08220 [Saprospiraceae bacterium]